MGFYGLIWCRGFLNRSQPCISPSEIGVIPEAHRLVAGLLLARAADAQDAAKTNEALNTLQANLSVCIAYFSIFKECSAGDEKDLSLAEAAIQGLEKKSRAAANAIGLSIAHMAACVRLCASILLRMLLTWSLSVAWRFLFRHHQFDTLEENFWGGSFRKASVSAGLKQRRQIGHAIGLGQNGDTCIRMQLLDQLHLRACRLNIVVAVHNEQGDLQLSGVNQS
jgi:hypothetical protein